MSIKDLKMTPMGKLNRQPTIDKRHLPYKFDDGIGQRARIGIIALPDDQTIEHELRMIFDLPGVACFVNRFEVPVMGSWNEPADAKVGRISAESIRKTVLDLGRSDRVDTVFISCTNLRALSILKELENEIEKPVISSNAALGWHCLRLAQINDRLPQYGSLLDQPIS